MKGFTTDTSLDSILDILVQQGLPSDYDKENILQNSQNGNLTVDNLRPEDYLNLIDKMNRRRFLNRQINVTSVVAETPVKKDEFHDANAFVGTTTIYFPTYVYVSLT